MAQITYEFLINGFKKLSKFYLLDANDVRSFLEKLRWAKILDLASSIVSSYEVHPLILLEPNKIKIKLWLNPPDDKIEIKLWLNPPDVNDSPSPIPLVYTRRVLITSKLSACATETSENYFQTNNKTKLFFLEIFSVPPKQTEPRSDY